MATGEPRAGPRSVVRPLGPVTAWQVVASTCFYALFAGTALLRSAYLVPVYRRTGA